MSIQSSINSALGTMAGVKTAKKLTKGQKDTKESIDNLKEAKELNIEKGQLEEGLNVANKELLESDETINDTEIDAMNTIDEFYNAQESGEPTDVQMYNKALQEYRNKIQAARLQQQGSVEWRNQLNERLSQIRSRMDSLKGGK